jgi:hypothetical protein
MKSEYLNKFFILKKNTENKVITDGKHPLIAHVKNKLVHLLKGRGSDRCVKSGTIVQLIECDLPNEHYSVCTFYVPSEDVCYLDVYHSENYEYLTVHPYLNRIWTDLNEV